MGEPTIEKVACDGGEMDVFVWTPERAPRAAMVVIHEIFGVGTYIRDVAERLAGLGYLVGAPDLFWRTDPHWAPANDQAGMGASMAIAGKLDPQAAIADCVATLHHLGALDGIDGRVGVLGFCVSYYGSQVPGMLAMVDDITCPILLHFGREDPYLPMEGVDAIAAATAGKDNVTINVEIAGHAFDNHSSEIFWVESAANAARAKTVAFLQTHLPA